MAAHVTNELLRRGRNISLQKILCSWYEISSLLTYIFIIAFSRKIASLKIFMTAGLNLVTRKFLGRKRLGSRSRLAG